MPACRLVGLDCRPVAPDGLDAFHVADLTHPDSIREIIRKDPPSSIYHLAGLLPPAPEPEMWRVNAGGIQAFLIALRMEKKTRARVLTIGSAAEYLASTKALAETSPCGGVSAYGRTKSAQSALALQYGREFGIPVMVARTFNLLGPGLPESLFAGSLCAQFSTASDSPIKVGNLASKRDFVDIRDAVAAYQFICDKGVAGEVYNVCRGEATSVQEILDLFLELSPVKRRVEQEASRFRGADVDRVCGVNRKLKTLGWKCAISVRQSIQAMLDAAGRK